MAEQYIGEIRLVGFTFAPVGWLACQGQLLSISGNEALFTLLGTTYGGDGQNTFALPDLRGRAPISQGNSPIGGTTYVMGQSGGTESVTLINSQLPLHSHPTGANNTGGSGGSPAGSVFGTNTTLNQYEPVASANAATGVMLTPTGGNQPHENRMPFLALNYIIATVGNFPSSN